MLSLKFICAMWSERNLMAAKKVKREYGSLQADAFLMYLVQQHTKLPTATILGFFSDLAKRVADIGWEAIDKKKRSQMRMYKEIHDFFPGTSIPFMIYVEGGKSDWHDEINYHASLQVAFPNQATYIKNEELDNIIMEKALLGGCDMPPFEKPVPRTPKMYKQLMKEISQKRLIDEN
jgi:hypothetical protein